MSPEFEQMKATWWQCFNCVLTGMHEALIRNQPERFRQEVATLQIALNDYLDAEPPVVACIGVAAEGAGPFSPTHVEPPRQKTPKAPMRSKPTCENCDYWQVGGPGVFACQNENSPRWAISTGAASTCDQHARKVRGQ